MQGSEFKASIIDGIGLQGLGCMPRNGLRPPTAEHVPVAGAFSLTSRNQSTLFLNLVVIAFSLHPWHSLVVFLFAESSRKLQLNRKT